MGLGVPEMMLAGAAIGGGTQLLRGKGLGGILQGAALGGAGGGLGGLASNAIQGAGIAGAAGGAGGVGGSLGAGAIPTSASAFNQSMGLSALPGMGTIESAGLVFNPTTGTYLNPAYYAGASTPFATYTGGQGLLSNATSGLLNKLPDYVTPQNVIGAANILSNTQSQQQMPTAPSGGVRQGQTSGLNVNMGNAQLIRRRGQE